MNLHQRSAGVLLHITSLPGPHGIGDLGPDAHHFVDWLAAAGQRIWQILPTTPIGPGDSPYQSVSAFAGSPLMVALEPLVAKGWLAPPDVAGLFEVSETFEGGGALFVDPVDRPHRAARMDRVDYARVGPWRLAQLRAAAAKFFDSAAQADLMAFSAWCESQSHWLDDYTLFMALADANAGAAWWHWPDAQRAREPAALAHARRELSSDVRFWQFVQWCFDTQWAALKAHANARGVSIMGDLPIFIAHHSADCWARPDLYELDADCQPTVVAGVPPDAFSAVGQRWGNPLYRWDRMAAEDYAWWVARVRRALAQTDAFRIDHFRGFAGYWEVPATSLTATLGRWMPGPGKLLFDALARALGPLPIVAEDLGVITPDVVALRDGCGFPGMRILQFAFGDDATNLYLPHHHTPASVVYTGTHDNDTSRGWWAAAPARERAFAAAYLDADAAPHAEVHWAMVRAAFTSVANTAIVPMQDVLGLDGTHRMNLPGTPTGNWSWRFDWSMVDAEPARRLALLTAATGRGAFGPLASG